MSRINLAKSIRSLEVKYAGYATRFDLEEWLKSQLLDTYLEIQEEDNLDNNFKFGETCIVFLTKQQIINLTKLDEEGKAIECSVCLKNFMLENYGIGSLTEGRTSIELTSFDFELISMQIAETIFEWNQYASILKSLGMWQKAKKKQQEP